MSDQATFLVRVHMAAVLPPWSLSGHNFSISGPAVLGAEDPHHLKGRSTLNLHSVILRISICNLQSLLNQLPTLCHVEHEDGRGGDDVLSLALPLKIPNNSTNLCHLCAGPRLPPH